MYKEGRKGYFHCVGIPLGEFYAHVSSISKRHIGNMGITISVAGILGRDPMTQKQEDGAQFRS